MSSDEITIEHQRLQTLFKQQRLAFRREGTPPLAQRRQSLQRLEEIILDNVESLVEAVNEDFGHRSTHETRLLELFPSVEGIRYAKRHLHRWMREERRSVSLWFQPAKARILYQPLGVVGIIVSWNYPLFVALGPLTPAIAAGNRALIKMSEFTPRTGKELQKTLAQGFSEEEVAVINGDVTVAQAFASLPFDHLLFTGSTTVGRLVMQAACANLTPVTLELGGKSPAIIGTDAQWSKAVERVIMGKLFNAGQTCVAPDYVLLPDGQEQVFIKLAQRMVQRHYPHFLNNPDYTHIINERQVQRLQNWLQDAVDKGATLIPLVSPQESSHSRKLVPTLILNTSPEMKVIQEEIFGPWLPVLSYQSLEEAIDYVNDRPRPLALYYFGQDKAQIQEVLENTTSGGVTINDTILHVAIDDLPFGGVGLSGMGHYHGREGFETFSKKKGVLYQSSLSSFAMLYPPYGKLIDFFLNLTLKK